MRGESHYKTALAVRTCGESHCKPCSSVICAESSIVAGAERCGRKNTRVRREAASGVTPSLRQRSECRFDGLDEPLTIAQALLHRPHSSGLREVCLDGLEAVADAVKGAPLHVVEICVEAQSVHDR